MPRQQIVEILSSSSTPMLVIVVDASLAGSNYRFSNNKLGILKLPIDPVMTILAGAASLCAYT